MFFKKIRLAFSDKLLLWCLIALLAGQVLYFWGFGLLYLVALLALLALKLPYPKAINSLLARTVVGGLLLFSLISLAAVVQLHVWPTSNFVGLSLICTALVVPAVLWLNTKTQIKSPTLFNWSDAGALVTALFFVLPMFFITFWGNDPVNLTILGSTQSQDGMAHSVALTEMGGAQHLTYLTNKTYYPKGFHIAGAVFLDAFGLHQHSNDWTTNARVFFINYLVLGFMLACALFYLAGQILTNLVKPSSAQYLLLAFIIGPSLSLFYLLPFMHQGFLNFYFICAAFICSLIFLPGFKLESLVHKWWVLAYFLFGFGITMSWGPLVLPVLCLIPVLYIASNEPNIILIIKNIASKYWIVLIGFALLAIPLYLHLNFATENAFNAYGAIRSLNYGILIAGLAVALWLVFARFITKQVRDFVFCVLTPMFLLVGLLLAAQYFTVGEPRYYSIKTSYLLEMIILVVGGTGFVFLLSQSKLSQLQQWIVGPLMFGVLGFMLIAVNANPLQAEQNMAAKPEFFLEDTNKITALGVKGELKVANNAILHYKAQENKIYANPLIGNWANGLVKLNEGNPVSAECTSKIFTSFAYGTGSQEEQKEVILALKNCVKDRTDQGKEFYIITDQGSVQHIKDILGELGNKVIFL